MSALIAETILAAVVAPLAPTAMVGMVTLLASSRGVRAAAWYALGYAFWALAFMIVAVTALHGATYPSARIHALIGGSAELVLGVALTAGAVGWFLGRRSRSRRLARGAAMDVAREAARDEPRAVAVADGDAVTPSAVPPSTEGDGDASPAGDRLQRWMSRVDHLPWIACFGLGLLLSVTRVRNIVTTLVVANAATSPDIGIPGGLVACALFLLVALVPVWLPLFLYRRLGDRGRRSTDAMERWLVAHGASLGTATVALFGLLLVAHGASQMAGLNW
jgi:hypothetical protein